MHDVRAPGADMPAQSLDEGQVELAALLVQDQLDTASRKLIDPAGVAGQRVDARLVSAASELPRKQDDLAFGAAEVETADDEQDSHRWTPRRSGCGAQFARGRLLEEKGATCGTAIEQEVERGEPGDEGLRAALRVFRMREFVPLHAYAGTREGLGVQILARPAEAGEQPVGAHRAAKVQDQIRSRA